jgi:hypothetical protein
MSAVVPAGGGGLGVTAKFTGASPPELAPLMPVSSEVRAAVPLVSDRP